MSGSGGKKQVAGLSYVEILKQMETKKAFVASPMVKTRSPSMKRAASMHPERFESSYAQFRNSPMVTKTRMKARNVGTPRARKSPVPSPKSSLVSLSTIEEKDAFLLAMEQFKGILKSQRSLFGNVVHSSADLFEAIIDNGDACLDLPAFQRCVDRLDFGFSFEQTEVIFDFLDATKSGLVAREDFILALKNPAAYLRNYDRARAKPPVRKKKKTRIPLGPDPEMVSLKEAVRTLHGENEVLSMSIKEAEAVAEGFKNKAWSTGRKVEALEMAMRAERREAQENIALVAELRANAASFTTERKGYQITETNFKAALDLQKKRLEELKEQNTLKVNDILREAKAADTEVRQMYEDKIKEMKVDANRAEENVTQTCNTQIARMKEENDRALKAMANNHEDEIRELKSQAWKEANNREKECNKTIDALKKELQRVTEECDASVSSLKVKLQSSKVAHQEEMVRFKIKFKTREEEHAVQVANCKAELVENMAAQQEAHENEMIRAKSEFGKNWDSLRAEHTTLAGNILEAFTNIESLHESKIDIVGKREELKNTVQALSEKYNTLNREYQFEKETSAMEVLQCKKTCRLQIEEAYEEKNNIATKWRETEAALAEKVAELKHQHAVTLETFTGKYDDTVASLRTLKEERASTIEEMQSAHHFELEKLQLILQNTKREYHDAMEDAKQVLTTTKDEYRTEKESIIEKYKTSLHKLESEIEQNNGNHKLHVQQLEETHRSKIEEVQAQVDRVAEQGKQMQKDHTGQLATLRQEHARNMDNAQKKHRLAFESFAMEHNVARKSLLDEREQIKTSTSAHVTNLKRIHKEQSNMVEGQLERLKEELAKARQEKAASDALVAETDAALRALRSEMATALTNTQREAENTKKDHDRAIMTMEESHKHEVQRLKEELEQLTDTSNGEISRLSTVVEERSRLLLRLREELKAANAEAVESAARLVAEYNQTLETVKCEHTNVSLTLKTKVAHFENMLRQKRFESLYSRFKAVVVRKYSFAFRTWHTRTQWRRGVDKQTYHVVQRIRNRLKARVFATFRGYVQVHKRLRTHCGIVMRRFARLALGKVWSAWVPFVHRRKRARVYLKAMNIKNTSHLRKGRYIRGWTMWRRFVSHQTYAELSDSNKRLFRTHRRHVVSAVFTRIRTRNLRMGFQTWVRTTDATKLAHANRQERAALEQKLTLRAARCRRQSLSIITNHQNKERIAVVFRQWVQHVTELKRVKGVSARILTRWRNDSMQVIFRMWVDATTEMKRNRVIIARFLAHLEQSTASKCLNRWVAFTRRRRYLRSYLSRAYSRWESTTLAHGYKRWVSWFVHAQLSQRHEHVMLYEKVHASKTDLILHQVTSTLADCKTKSQWFHRWHVSAIRRVVKRHLAMLKDQAGAQLLRAEARGFEEARNSIRKYFDDETSAAILMKATSK